MSTEENSLSVQSLREKAIATFAETFQARVKSIDPAIYDMDEIELEKHFKPSSNDFFLRRKFWQIAERNMSLGMTDVSIAEVYEGVLQRSNFYTNWIKNQYRFAWCMLPLTQHVDLIEEGFYLAIKKVKNELLAMPVNEKTAGHILKALEFFANRAIGPVIQRIEQKNLNLNVASSEKKIDTNISVDDKLKEIQEKLTNSKTVIDVEPE